MPSSAAPHDRSSIESVGTAFIVPSVGPVVSTPISRPALTMKSGVPAIGVQLLAEPLISFALTSQSYEPSASAWHVAWTVPEPVT